MLVSAVRLMLRLRKQAEIVAFLRRRCAGVAVRWGEALWRRCRRTAWRCGRRSSSAPEDHQRTAADRRPRNNVWGPVSARRASQSHCRGQAAERRSGRISHGRVCTPTPKRGVLVPPFGDVADANDSPPPAPRVIGPDPQRVDDGVQACFQLRYERQRRANRSRREPGSARVSGRRTGRSESLDPGCETVKQIMISSAGPAYTCRAG